MITRPVEEMITDPSYSDDEVREAILDTIGKETPDRERDGVTQDEYEKRIEESIQANGRRGDLVRKHRPALHDRMMKEVADQHYYCCGPGAKKD